MLHWLGCTRRCCVCWGCLANSLTKPIYSFSCISQTWFVFLSCLWRDASCTVCPDWKHVDDCGQLLQLHWNVASSTSSFARSTSQYKRCFGGTYLGWIGDYWWRRPTSEQWTLCKCRWGRFTNWSTSWEVTQSKAMTHTLKVCYFENVFLAKKVSIRSVTFVRSLARLLS